MALRNRFGTGLHTIVVLLWLGLLLSPFISDAALNQRANGPMAVAQEGVNQGVAIFKDQRMTLEVRRERLREVAGRFIDFEDMSRSVMGYHWRDLTPAQRAEFVPLFTGFIQDALLSRMHQSNVQRIRNGVESATIDFTKEQFDGPDYAEVHTTVLVPTEQKDPLQVTLLMHRRDNTWRCYDITIDAISVVSNYRTQFNRVINEQGFNKLVEVLRDKRAAFEEEMAHPHPAS